MKQGIIFERNRDVGAVSVGVQISRLRRLVWWLDRFGLGMLVGGGVFMLWVVWPVIREEGKFVIGQTGPGKAIERVSNMQPTKVISFTAAHAPEKPSWIVPDMNYSIYIPRILAKSKIVPDVDPFDKAAYLQALQQGVAAAAKMAHPGEKGTTYLFAHSVGSRMDFARYNAIFYLLHRLEIGDAVELVYKGQLYKYVVSERNIVPASDLSYLTPQFDKETLVLQTCYPPGTSWKRLIVVAVRKTP